LPSLPKRLFYDRSPSVPRRGRRRKASRSERRSVYLEPLEPRILLSADPLVPFAVSASSETNDLTLRLDELTRNLQIVDNQTAAIVAEQGVDQTSEVVIAGSEGDDRLTLTSPLPSTLPIAFDGGAGNDTLVGSAVDATWIVTGPDAGSVGTVTFDGVENLAGAADNEDRFVVQPGGGLTGGIDGGDAGFDTLAIEGGSYTTVRFVATGPDSGSVELDGTAIVYAGLEPLELSLDESDPDNIIVEATAGIDDLVLEVDPDGGFDMRVRSLTGSMETVRFDNPSATLTIDAGAEADRIRVDSLAPGFAAELILIGGDGDDVLEGISTYAETYRFGNDWGSDAIVDEGVANRLDFSGFDGALTLRAPSAANPEVVGERPGETNTLDYTAQANLETALEVGAHLDPLRQGLADLSVLAGELGAADELAQPLLPLTDTSIGAFLDIGSIVDESLVQVVVDFLATAVDPTL
jgi:hypothetical protein